MKRLFTVSTLILVLTIIAAADDKKKRFEDADFPALQKAKAVIVEKADKDADVAMIDELKKWGRWKVVADESEADLIIRLRASGSGGMGTGQ